ncbi:four helix bundle protein [Chryseobacterium gleum]|uniref:Four helix bundle protein n=2 Tax=Chryseobacterium gleum TaxID=250 RepID=A0A448B896_CHRGE|nr:four helix bundle protein [Chryseobacterium gleum]EFK36769.1 S23 ribosomal protein [Chryseobacterium gleum ATCC 35910]QQY32025.1 four helix bundle protein [Chryseobacterium gleum]VEE10754.1 four helix bundle protein [Chryseobacterium gleum]
MYKFYFEKLEVWNNARSLVKDIYQITSLFSENEKFGITNQIRRATTSITANIAEGMCRSTEKEKSRFISISFGSCIEVINFLIISNDLEFLDNKNYEQLRIKTESISNQLNALYKTLNIKKV